MRKYLILVGALMTAGTAHAQASMSTGGGINTISGITPYRIATMGSGASSGDPRASQVISAKNDGLFLPSIFAAYDQAVEIGQLAANARPPMLGDVARSVREQKKNSKQTAVLIVEQDQNGKMITTAQRN